jgi:adenine-specific DNA methylase
MKNERALIEVDFPIREVSEESAREKNIRHGHISTLHIWWARRPLAASRASILAALTPVPKNSEELEGRLKFISEFSKWENSLNKKMIEEARALIKQSFSGKTPKVLDCFAGGGAIPLEALRLGCETYALDLNPVAVLILKATLEYPQKYGRKEVKENNKLFDVTREINPLLEDVKKWGNWVLEEARKEIEGFYPNEEDGSIPVGYIWARTIRCQNPSCNVEIPLIRQFWLARKEKKKVALKMLVDKQNKKIDFKVVRGKEIDFDPSQGTTRKATVLCPVCGSGIDDNTTRKEAREGRMGQRMIAVVLHHPDKEGKSYRIATEKDLEVFKKAEKYLEEKIRNWRWDFNPIPDEKMPPKETLGFRVQRYGILKWGDLFNSRQKLALITFVEKVRQAHEKMLAEGYDEEYAKAVVSYLGLGVNRLADKNSVLCRLIPQTEAIGFTYGRQALPMLWDYIEMSPMEHVSGWITILSEILGNIEHCCNFQNNPATITQSSATSLPYPDNYFDAVITDPPYYDNVPYSDLSDFFYVWLKRTIGDLYPELFSTPLTPKSQEIVQNPVRHDGDRERAKQFFEDMLTQAFKEIYRVLKPEGIACIVFAHKSTDAWETIINSLLKSGLVLTASWPVHTEMKARLRAKESAALASSILVCRKRTKEETAYYNDIKAQIEARIKEKLAQFWREGISGADFFISAIGPAVEVFGRYSKVEKLSGEEISTSELLEYVRKVVSEFSLERILRSPNLGGVDKETRFYLLWRWTYNNLKVHFDDARKLSQAVGIELMDYWDKSGFVRKEKEFIRILNPIERAKDDGLKREKPTSMIDVIHKCLLYWEKGEKNKLKELLEESGYAKNEIFWQVAQAISEVLPEGGKEKQLLQGFLYTRGSYVKDARQTTLSDIVEDK